MCAVKEMHGALSPQPEPPSGAFPPCFVHLIHILPRVLAFTEPVESFMRIYFADHPILGRRDRAFIRELLYFIIRRKSRMEKWQAVGGGMVEKNALLAHFAHEASLPQAAATMEEFPSWLITRLQQHASDDQVLRELQGLNEPAALDLRVGPERARREEVLQKLRQNGHEALPTPYSPLGIRCKDKPPLQNDVLLRSGVDVQDEGSQLMCLMLGPRRGDRVVDFCAGAGGKALTMAMLMREGHILAFDIDGARLARLKSRHARNPSKVLLSIVTLHDEKDDRLARWRGKIDKVLVDAPCSGLGMVRRQPDLLWRRTADELPIFVARQQRILRAAAALVRPGGLLLYGTCSILWEENQQVVEDFIAEHPHFQRKTPSNNRFLPLNARGDLHIRPHSHGTDGFYAALLVRGGA